jgi:methylmalonyl-CoA mutase
MSENSHINDAIRLEKTLDLTSDFAPPSYKEWKTAAEEHLKGVPFEKALVTQTYENINLQPIYRKQDIENLPFLGEKPGFGYNLRGTSTRGYLDKPWDICQAIPYDNPEELNHALRCDLERGQTAVQLSIGANGIISSETLAVILKDIDVEKIPIHIDSGFSGLDTYTAFNSFLSKEDLSPAKVNGSISADPLGHLAAHGSLPVFLETAYDHMADVTQKAKKEIPNLKTIGISGIPYHNAGASAVQELAFVLASAVETIDRMIEKGLSIDDIAPRMRFTFGIGPFYFMEIARLRAARLLWAKIVESYGGSSESQKMRIHGVTSFYNQTIYDPYVNMLRTTTEAFSAVVGGVDSLQTNPFDQAFAPPDEFSRRIARNTQIVLKEESHLDRPIDPAGGSYYVEKLTHEVAQKAWDLFRETEKLGGMFAALQVEFPQTLIHSTAEKREKDLAKRKAVMVGTNFSANVKEKILKSVVQRETKALPPVVSIKPLPLHRVAGIFEELRNAVEKFEAETGAKPKLFLATMGPLRQHKARADFSQGFFEVAGFDIIYPTGFDTPEAAVKAALESGAPVVTICSTDETYPELVPPFVKALKEKNPGIVVVLAGFPKDQVDAHKEAGVDEFIYLGADARLILANLLKKIGVLS